MKLLAFFSLQIICVFGLSGNPAINLPEIELDTLNWQQDKINTLVGILNALTEVGNVTLIGWQHIHNSDGTLKEIKTIELTLLSEIPSENLLDSEDIDVLAELPVILDLKNDLQSITGILLTGSIQQWSRDGVLEDFLLVNQNQDIFTINDDGLLLGIVNVTVPSVQSVNPFMKLLQGQTNLPVSVLKYVQGEIDIQNSVIVPHLLGSVTAMENATQWMVDAALLGLSQGVLKQADVTKNVALRLKHAIPNYLWHVAEGVVGSYVTSDVAMDIVYDWFSVDNIEDLEFSVYGVKV